MLLKFIGSDSSMGLHCGSVYDVDIYSESKYIYVRWLKDWCQAVVCPYSSPQAFARNWTRPD